MAYCWVSENSSSNGISLGEALWWAQSDQLAQTFFQRVGADIRLFCGFTASALANHPSLGPIEQSLLRDYQILPHRPYRPY